MILGDDMDKLRRYPLLSGKNDLRKSLVDSFPGEVVAIDKFLAMLKVNLFKSFHFWIVCSNL